MKFVTDRDEQTHYLDKAFGPRGEYWVFRTKADLIKELETRHKQRERRERGKANRPQATEERYKKQRAEGSKASKAKSQMRKG